MALPFFIFMEFEIGKYYQYKYSEPEYNTCLQFHILCEVNNSDMYEDGYVVENEFGDIYIIGKNEDANNYKEITRDEFL